MTEYPIILGVYSRKQETSIGVGDTATKRETTTYWFARQIAPDLFDIQPLNIYHAPSGVMTKLSERDFLTSYTPEPNYYRMFTVPALTSLAAKLAEGEEFLAKGQLDAAEKAFLKALMIDDLHVKANYGLGTVYSEQNDAHKLRKVLNTLLNVDSAFSAEHREKFNAFGISLRKNKHYDEALSFYSRALELEAMDEHVYFNMARAYFEKQQVDECINSLNIALAINPEFEEAKKFLCFCEKKRSPGQGHR